MVERSARLDEGAPELDAPSNPRLRHPAGQAEEGEGEVDHAETVRGQVGGHGRKDWDGGVSDQELIMFAAAANLLNQNILKRDLERTGQASAAAGYAEWVASALEEMGGTKSSDVVRGASNLSAKVLNGMATVYAGGDTIGKISGLLVEMRAQAKIHPNATMDVVMQIAAERVMNTTPTFDKVPTVLKTLSVYGFGVTQYVSFISEMFRNTSWSYAYAYQDIRDGFKNGNGRNSETV